MVLDLGENSANTHAGIKRFGQTSKRLITDTPETQLRLALLSVIMSFPKKDLVINLNQLFQMFVSCASHEFFSSLPAPKLELPFQVGHGKKKTPPTFHCTGWLIRILTMVDFYPWVVFHPLYTLNNQGHVFLIDDIAFFLTSS